MNVFRFLLIVASLSPVVGPIPAVRAESPAAVGKKALLDLSARGAENRATPTYGADRQVRVARSQDPAAPGLSVTIQPGKANYPGIDLKPEGKAWDLSAYGRVEARVINSGSRALRLSLRVDNEGNWQDAPWNTEQVSIEPGAASTVSVVFGHSFGRKPSYKLNPAAVVKIVMFVFESDAEQSFRVESLVAAGPAGEKPPVDPRGVRVKPHGGVLLGPGVKIDPARQIDATGGAQGSLVAGAEIVPSLRLVIPAATKGESSVALKSVAGCWDLSDACEVRVQVKNAGHAPVMPSVQLISNGGPTDRITAASPLAAGARRQIVVPFAPAVPFQSGAVLKPGHHGGRKGTGTSFTSDAVGRIAITVSHGGEAALLVESITAAAPPAVIPDWLGKRPPVSGDWVKTFEDDFDGPVIDQAKWNIYGPNYWDKKTHWSKDNLFLKVASRSFISRRSPDTTTTIRSRSEPIMPAAFWRPMASGCSVTGTSRRG